MTRPRLFAVDLFASVLLAASAAAQEWRPASPPPPPPLTSHEIAFDGQGLITFGGGTGSPLIRSAETRRWDGSAWNLLPLATKPSARHGHKMVWDSLHRRVLLFGGRQGDSFATIVGDTWEWDGATWTQRQPPRSPAPRQNHGMAFDSVRGVVVLFGGIGRDGNMIGDTWEWDGTTTAWTEVPVHGPSLRNNLAMGFDAAHGYTLVYGGHAQGGFHDDTWAWNGASWTRLATKGPGGRAGVRMSYDSYANHMVLFGGGAGSNNVWRFFSDTLIWRGTSWEPLSSIVSSVSFWPAARADHAMGYDPLRRCTVLYGGTPSIANNAYSDTWELASFASSRSIGVGCAGTSGVPTLAAAPGSAAVVGQTLVLELASLPPGGANFSLMLLGREEETPPFDLGTIGMTACTLYVKLASASIVLVMGSGGTASWSVAIPDDPSLLGRSFYNQALPLDPGANTLGMTASNAVVSTYGVKP